MLAGASGNSLAFGPGHLDGTALPGERGNCVLSGHRDTHFRFLARLQVGDELELEAADGTVQRFVVRATQIMHRWDISVLDEPTEPLLTLITCYPFDAVVPGGPLRFVVQAEPVVGADACGPPADGASAQPLPPGNGGACTVSSRR